jgi:CheY-like chemotaxis protein
MADNPGGRLILVVDDDDDSAALITSHLHRRGHRVMRARSGEDTLRIMSCRHVDLLIVDLLLPGMDGWQLITTLRSGESTKTCPVVVCSVVARQDYPKDVDGMLPKPYTRRQLWQILEQVLSNDKRP